jgi:cysteine desulfurase
MGEAMNEIIYLDNAATTKPTSQIEKEIFDYCHDHWYNPSALYQKSSDVYLSMDNARKKILKALGVLDGQVFFTSGGTESNNIAINSAIGRKKSHFITSQYEHDAVFNVMKNLETDHDVTYIKPNHDGVIMPQQVIDEIKENTVLVSIMHVNNETGGLNDIGAIACAVKAKNADICFHSDGVQAFLKHKSFLNENIDLYSMSAHKVGGLKGIGALYAKKGYKVKPLMFGGGQEKGVRNGTENTFGIATFVIAIDAFISDFEKIHLLHNRLIDGLGEINDCTINSPTNVNGYSPYIVNASIIGVRGETLLHALEPHGIYIGIGSACSSKKRTNRIHDAIGLNRQQSESTIRVSFSNDNKIEDVDYLIECIKKEVEILRIFKRR